MAAVESWRDIYYRLFVEGDYSGWKAKIIELAKWHRRKHSDDVLYNEKDSVWDAFETYEAMTGNFIDPTEEQFEELVSHIY